MVRASNSNTWEAESGRALSLSLAGDIMSVLSCPELCNKTLSQNTQHWFVLPFLPFSLPSSPLPSPLRLRPMDHKYESSLCFVMSCWQLGLGIMTEIYCLLWH